MELTVDELAKLVQGTVAGDGSLVLKGVAPASSASEGDLTFADNEVHLGLASASRASAVLVSSRWVADGKTSIQVAEPRIAFAKVLTIFFPEPSCKPGIHPSAVVASSATVHPSAHIGPLCVIGERAQIGPDAILVGHVNIGELAIVGEGSRIFPNVTIYHRVRLGKRVRIHAGTVIGSDGFGYAFGGGLHHKIPQVGAVVIEDDVEIGANTAIDRGALEATVIGAGSKIDNLVQIAHNVVVGKHCVVVSQVGIAGSTKLGSYVTLAGQVGLAGHLTIGDKVVVAAQSGVMTNIPAGEKWLGAPAAPDRQMKRQMLAAQRLPDLLKRVARLERHLSLAVDDPIGEKP